MEHAEHHSDHSHGDHSHDHHDHNHHGTGGMHIHPVVKDMRLALVINLAFTCIEFAGGLWTNSVAILSDAIHDLGDSIAIIAALVLEKHSLKGRTDNFTYGKRRFSILAAFFTSLVLVIGSILIATEAIPRFFSPESVNSSGMVWLSVIGIFFNGLAFFRLRKNAGSSLNQRAVSLHMLEDVLGWVCVLIGSIVMYFTDWYWIDPLMSLGIAVYILFNAVKNIGSALKIFLQSVPENFDEQKLFKSLKSLDEIVDIHDVHCWTMDGEYHVISLHVVVSNSVPLEEWHGVRNRVLEIIREQKIGHATVQLEPEEEHCALEHC